MLSSNMRLDAYWVENMKQESQQMTENDKEGPEVTEEEDSKRNMIARVK